MKTFIDGIIKNNPVLVLAIGLCPTLAVSTSAYNSIGMGIAVIFILTCSNLIVSAMKKIIPDNLRIPIFIIIISTFVTIVDYVMKGYFPALSKNLGVFVPLIVVNCIILGRAEGFAYRSSVIDAILDGLGSGLGFTLIIFLMGSIREILGAGTWMSIPGGFQGFYVFGKGFLNYPVLFMILPPGGFLVIAIFMGIQKFFQMRREK